MSAAPAAVVSPSFGHSIPFGPLRKPVLIPVSLAEQFDAFFPGKER
jgi:hypothetical protein